MWVYICCAALGWGGGIRLANKTKLVLFRRPQLPLVVLGQGPGAADLQSRSNPFQDKKSANKPIGLLSDFLAEHLGLVRRLQSKTHH